MKKTAWYPIKTKPVRVGAYETQLMSLISGNIFKKGFSWWDGKRWLDTRSSLDLVNRKDQVGGQNKKWRGLTKETK